MIGISAQVSLYPLGQEDLSPAIDAVLRIFREHGLEVNPGPMSTLISGGDQAVFAALQAAFQRAAGQGRVVMVVTLSNAYPLPEPETDTGRQPFHLRAIGRVENEFDKGAKADQIRSAESRIILDPTLAGGIKGLEPGQQIMVVFYFHRSEGFDLLQHPRGDQGRPKRGVFTLRSPRRPNPIGVTVVDLIAIEDNVLRVRGLDAIHGTPVLDLKPV